MQMKSLHRGEKDFVRMDRSRRILSYFAAVTVIYISCLSFSSFFPDILPETLDGVWTSLYTLEDEGINLTCFHDSTRYCVASIKIKKLVIENFSIQFVFSQFVGWVGVKSLSEDGWVFLRHNNDRLIFRILKDFGVDTFVLERPQDKNGAKAVWKRKGRYIFLIFFAVGLFKWVQLRFFSDHPKKNAIRYRKNFL
ncbi:hypothetical protein TcG_00095 [Trypanosoma cruzi]|nr:hypothetical protein TcG_00095 [Trypanosoma cruzi]